MPELTPAFAALADATRRSILARLAEGEAGVMELAGSFEITQPAVSYHLKVLESAGLITRRVDGARRPCRLSSDGLEAIDEYLGLLRAAFRANYARLDQVLAGSDTPERKGS